MIDTIILWMNDHHNLLYLGVFILSLIEFTPLIGNIVPGTTALIFISFLSAQTDAKIQIILILGFIGSIIGDVIAYNIGRRYKLSLLYKLGIAKDEREYEKMSKKALREGKWISFMILGKINSLVRAFVSYVAGARNYSIKTFVFITVLGNTFWIGVYILFPYILGTLAKKYIYFINTGVLLVVVLLFLAISVADGSLKEIIERIKKQIN